MLDRREIHFFNEIGYRHGMYEHCPENPALQLKCACDPKDNVGKCLFCLESIKVRVSLDLVEMKLTLAAVGVTRLGSVFVPATILRDIDGHGPESEIMLHPKTRRYSCMGD